MSIGHFARSLDHVAAVHAARESLRDLYRGDGQYRAAEVAQLIAELGDALKLAEVHATLAVVEAIDNLVDSLDERLAPRVVSRLEPHDPAAPGAEQLGMVVAGPVVDR